MIHTFCFRRRQRSQAAALRLNPGRCLLTDGGVPTLPPLVMALNLSTNSLGCANHDIFVGIPLQSIRGYVLMENDIVGY